jgi:uncharacterized protein (DUF1684 family)
MAMSPAEATALLDWKRRIFSLYSDIRAASDAEAAWRRWRDERDLLFSTHAQTPLKHDARESFAGLPYYDYSPGYRVLGNVAPADPRTYEIATSGDGTYEFTRFGTAAFELQGRELALELYWLEGYGGGLFLPFRDATSGTSTYGAGRYLFDTVKGADLGYEDGRLVLDFNFAYNPSCAYDPQWVCPLPPPPNRLDIAIEAGERI